MSVKLAGKQRRLDVIEQAEEFVRSGRFTDLNRSCVHERFLQATKAGGEVLDALVDHIYCRQMNHFGAVAPSLEHYLRQKERFTDEIWPVLQPMLKRNAGMAQFMLEHGVDSDYVARFLYDIQKAQGVSVLLGHGIGHTVLDELEALPPSDNAFAFYYDASFGIFRFRTIKAQAEMRQAKQILFLGGGADPALYARRYPLGELNQKIVVYDHDPQMSRYLEQIAEQPLNELGVDYRSAELEVSLADKSQHGIYDLICVLGIAAYYSDRSKMLFDGIYDLLAPGGKVIFDIQSYHPVLAFDVGVLGWPTTMRVEPTIDAAKEVALRNCANSSLNVLWCEAEQVSEPFGVPAGVVTLAQKPID